MAIMKCNPVTAGRRNMSMLSFDEITASKPLKALTEGKKRISGRNNYGRITTRHMGGGHKRRYRIVDFKRDNFGVEGLVKTVEYDPNRNARICLVFFPNGDKRYILCPNGLTVGAKVVSGENAPIAVGNALPLKNIPVGSVIHNVEMKSGKGGQLARAAGASIILMAKEGDYAQLKMKSGEIRTVRVECLATIGEVGNGEQSLIKIGKAGRKRWMGIRPTVRGIAMNPVDHPHGGGEGKGKGGNHPQSPTGVLAKGYKTRKNKRTTVITVPRSIKKGPFVDEHLAQKCAVAKQKNDRKVIKTWSRRSMILPDFIGLNIAVHNGNKFIPLYITENMVGHKLGEFSPTRTYRGHSTKDDKKAKK
ncbi:hypothetical protein CHS0354_027357 [Potamilus streckersoni]|uniref:Large ribosomal subunit protein uL2 n=1 Tax=Potamilus streckersoni TaxID=2493646 RepID=A0AAE0W0L6_9BIVA|nr:hypothetical protein CHS0354_027357 [Potamilus streckersoni]